MINILLKKVNFSIVNNIDHLMCSYEESGHTLKEFILFMCKGGTMWGRYHVLFSSGPKQLLIETETETYQ